MHDEFIVQCMSVLEHFIGRGVMPSVKLALDHVNEHSQILRNYRLHMWWNDTMVRKTYLFLIYLHDWYRKRNMKI